MNYIDHLLGSRRTSTQNFEPGFIRTNQNSIEQIALLSPIAIDILALLAQNRAKLHPGLKQIVQKLQFCCSRRPGELPLIENKRIKRTIIITPLILAAMATCCVAIYVLVKKGLIVEGEEKFAELIAKISIVKHIENFVEGYETKPCVFTGYGLIGTVHSVQALKQRKVSKIRMGKHIIAALIAFMTPVVMAIGIYETRWHHMSYGQLSLVPNLNALNFFGGMLVLDSMLYWLKPMKDNYDYSNIFCNHMTAFFVQIATLSVFQIVGERFFNKLSNADVAAYAEDELKLLTAEDKE